MVFHIHDHRLYIHVGEVHIEHVRRSSSVWDWPIKEDKQQSLSLLSGDYYPIRYSVTQSVLIATFMNIKHSCLV